MNTIKNQSISKYLDNLLKVNDFKDYCPNGLQIQGKDAVNHLVTGVTINQELINQAIAIQADGILVHHGMFWKGDDFCIREIKKQRIQSILAYDINLWAYHLPLDAHPIYGNNACLANMFNFKVDSNFGDQNLGCLYNVQQEDYTWQKLSQKIQQHLNNKILVIGNTSKDYNIKTIAWCSGGAQSYFLDAIHAGCNVFISGEISEQYVHIAREYDVLYMVCGHHATERYGVQAIGNHLKDKYGIKHTFVDIASPI